MKKSRVYKCLYGQRDGYTRKVVYVQADNASEAARKLEQMLDKRDSNLFGVMEVLDIGEFWEREPNQ